VIELEGKDSLATHKHIDKNEHEIEKISKEVYNLVNNYLSDKNIVNGQLAMLENYFKLTDVANSLDVLLSKLIWIKNEGEKGFCSSIALNSGFLQRNLQRLEANTKGIGPIFAYWKWRKYYRYQLCTLVQDSHNIWLTLRIPMVKKVEKFVRIIPNSDFLTGISSFTRLGLSPMLFKEISSEVYHLMDTRLFETCTKLGSLRTCNVRSVLFSDPDLIPVEYAHNRIIFLGKTNDTKNAVLRCGRITNIKIQNGQVMTLPNNCSVKAKAFEIEERIMDERINKVLSVSDFEFSFVNLTKFDGGDKMVVVMDRDNNISKLNDITFELDKQLEKIHFEHRSAWDNLTKTIWITSTTLGLSILAIVVCWLIRRCLKCVKCNETEGKNEMLELQDFSKNAEVVDESANEGTNNDVRDNSESGSGRRRNNV
jgi:hypothetical protein